MCTGLDSGTGEAASAAASPAAAGSGSGVPAAGATQAHLPTQDQPFSAEELDAISRNVQAATYTIATVQATLPFIAMKVGAKFPDAELGLRTAQLRKRTEKAALVPVAQMSAESPLPPRILTLQHPAEQGEDNWYEGCPIDVAQSAAFSQGFAICSMHELHVYQLVPESVADPAGDDSSGNGRMNGAGNAATHAVWARIGTARLAGSRGVPLVINHFVPDVQGLARLYGRPGAWTPADVGAAQAAAEEGVQAFHEVMLLNEHGQRIAGHPLNSG